MEIDLSRIITPDSAGRERTRLTRAIVLAIRELAKQTKPGVETRDLASFISLSLEIVARKIDISVAAWEKRDYWVKADKFRMEWTWAGDYANKMRLAVQTDDWRLVSEVASLIAQRLNKINVPARNQLGKPWVGAWDQLRKQYK
jgi:hypothetical protein